MKIKINRRYVEDYQLERVKADAKEFQADYTEQDLLWQFQNQAQNLGFVEIVKSSVEALDSGWAMGNVTIFSVDMLLKAHKKYIEITFYIGKDMKIDTSDIELGRKMYSIREYKLA